MLDTILTPCNDGSSRVGSSLMQRKWPSLLLILGLLCLGVCALANQRVHAQSPEASATSAMTETAAAQANANVALIKSAYDAFSRGDIPTAMAAFAEDIFWHVPGRGPLSSDYRGHAEVLGFFGHFMELSGGTFRLRVDEVLAKGDRVVVLCTESARRGGRSWTAPQVHVWTVKDGKATVFWEYEGDEYGDDEFWSSPGRASDAGNAHISGRCGAPQASSVGGPAAVGGVMNPSSGTLSFGACGGTSPIPSATGS